MANKGWLGLRHQADYAILAGFVGFTLLWLLDILVDDLLVKAGIEQPHLAKLRSYNLFINLGFFVVQFLFIGFVLRVLRRRSRLETELEAARHAAEEEKNRSVAIIAAIGDGISIQDRDFRILYQNRVHQEIVGGDFSGQRCYEVYDGGDAVCDGCPIASVFADGCIQKREKALLTGPDRNISQIEITASPLHDAEGNIVAGIEVVRDISARKEAEKAAKSSAAFLQSLLDTIPSPIFYKDAKGVYLGCNSAFELMLGRKREEVVGRSVYDLSPRELADIYFQKDAELFARPGVQVYEASVRFSDGTTREVIFSKATFDDAEGNVAGLVGVVLDISERKRAERQIQELNAILERRAQELAAANEELEAFSFSLSHDLRLPLTRIYTAAQILMESAGAAAEDGRFLLSTICEASEKMEELIDAMLALCRITCSELRCEPVDLSGLAEESAAQFKLPQCGDTVEVAVTPGLSAYGDRRLLKAALENLLENAWKYSRHTPMPRIEVGAEDRGGEKVFFVRDNGSGFDMAEAGRLFKPFQRLHSDGDFPGIGVGLATVQRIIQRHGGRIWAEGAPGEGATFYFYLP